MSGAPLVHVDPRDDELSEIHREPMSADELALLGETASTILDNSEKNGAKGRSLPMLSGRGRQQLLGSKMSGSRPSGEPPISSRPPPASSGRATRASSSRDSSRSSSRASSSRGRHQPVSMSESENAAPWYSGYVEGRKKYLMMAIVVAFVVFLAAAIALSVLVAQKSREVRTAGGDNQSGRTGSDPNGGDVGAYDDVNVRIEDLTALFTAPDEDNSHVSFERYQAMYDAVSPLVADPNGSLAPGSGTPQRLALRWIVNYDPSQIAPEDESLHARFALTTLFFALQGVEWYVRQRWLVHENVCIWYGVQCQTVLAADGVTMKTQVIGLSLPQNNLQGGPMPLTELSGGLPHLRELIFPVNSITNELSESLGNFALLETLALHNNTITGELPNSIGNLKKMKYMLMHGNRITGRLPREVGMLHHLEELHLYDNDMFGPLPPDLGFLHNLRRLWLSSNRFTGPIPGDLGNMVSMDCLYLDENELAGPLPPRLADATMLMDIRLNSNLLTGNIPQEYVRMRNINLLYLDDNRMSGKLPPALGLMTGLRELALHRNSFTGVLPRELGSLTNLEVLVLGDNKFTGQVPRTFSQLTRLNKLRLYRNNFSGPLPDLSRARQLDDLELQDNSFQGVLPAWLGTLPLLRNMILSKNKFSGNIPRTFEGLGSLTVAKMEWNNLVGNVPRGLCSYAVDTLVELVVDCTVQCDCCTSCLSANQQLIMPRKGFN